MCGVQRDHDTFERVGKVDLNFQRGAREDIDTIELGVATPQATLLNWQSLNAQTNSVLNRVAQTSENLSHNISCTLPLPPCSKIFD